jgi:hypothetical protein
MLLGGIVNENVEPAKLFYRLLNRLLAERLVADVTRDENAPAAFLLDLEPRLIGISVLVQIEDRDIRPLLRKVNRDGAADSAIATGDQCDATLELARRFVLRPLKLGARSHFGLDARTSFLVLRRLSRRCL